MFDLPDEGSGAGVLHKARSESLCNLPIDFCVVMWYTIYREREREVKPMKNNTYRKTTEGKYTYTTKKVAHKKVRKANKKACRES